MNMCVWEGCDNLKYKRGLCNKHYQKARTSGQLEQFEKMDRTSYRICLLDGCNEKHCAKGYCSKHWQRYGTKRCKIEGCNRAAQKNQTCPYHQRRIDRGLALDAEFGLGAIGRKICQFQDCGRFVSGNGLCGFHRRRQRLNVPLDAPRRNRYKQDDVCMAKGCFEKPYALNYCKFHVGRFRKGLDIDKPKLVLKKISFIPLKEELESFNWSKNANGYLMTSVGRKHVLQHRAVWEAHNGRKLQKFENIHHLNGIRDDNRIENLELWTKPQPIGQRPGDLVAWVIEHYREEVLRAIDTRLELDLQPRRQQP